ncbi:hypothetical protein [Streptomyces resistomycificus]|uniref:Lipoprotein n=1 Tax=Streptomyces resistomycificus TaxID=67356 RepID=A0A0L8KZW0_9ACTN|nr:hypothetical protein [Streptomyces resistomycificus]KOG31371.1 hypothetical protein ADK37_30870 [Streptomyces resistomycificus]
MKRAFAVACVGAVIVALTSVGCSATASHDGGRADSGGTGAGSVDATPGSEAVGRELTDAEQILVQRAEARLVKTCMESKGFKYWAWSPLTVDDLKGGGYVLTDVTWAKKNGYGGRLADRLQHVQRDDPNSKYANALPEQERIRYSRTLEGGPSSGMLSAELPAGGTVRTPRHGCQAEAGNRLYGDFETWFRAEKIATNLSPLYVPALLKDRRFGRAVEQWSTCMRQAGHPYADPPSVRRQLPSLTQGLSSARAHAAEVELAVAEATCATTTPLGDTARTLDAEYRDKKLGRYAADIASYRRMGLAALARAEDITGSTA